MDEAISSNHIDAKLPHRLLHFEQDPKIGNNPLRFVNDFFLYYELFELSEMKRRGHRDDFVLVSCVCVKADHYLSHLK